MSEHSGGVPELAPNEVFVDRQTYENDMPGRVPSEDVAADTVYTYRGLTGSNLDPYYAGELPVQVTKLTKINETDHAVTLKHVIPEGEEEFYAPQDLILRDGMFLRVQKNVELADGGEMTKEDGYMVDKDQLWDNAFRRMSAAIGVSELALAGASRL